MRENWQKITWPRALKFVKQVKVFKDEKNRRMYLQRITMHGKKQYVHLKFGKELRD